MSINIVKLLKSPDDWTRFVSILSDFKCHWTAKAPVFYPCLLDLRVAENEVRAVRYVYPGGADNLDDLSAHLSPEDLEGFRSHGKSAERLVKFDPPEPKKEAILDDD